MTPEAAIAALDRQSATAGQIVTFRRVAGAVTQEAECWAVVRGMDQGETINGSGMLYGEKRIIVSPTDMDKVAWPWPVQAHDKVIINGKTHSLLTPDIRKIGDVVVRMEVRAKGN